MGVYANTVLKKTFVKILQDVTRVTKCPCVSLYSENNTIVSSSAHSHPHLKVLGEDGGNPSPGFSFSSKNLSYLHATFTGLRESNLIEYVFVLLIGLLWALKIFYYSKYTSFMITVKGNRN